MIPLKHINYTMHILRDIWWLYLLFFLGRPFVVEMINPRKVSISEEDLLLLQQVEYCKKLTLLKIHNTMNFILVKSMWFWIRTFYCNGIPVTLGEKIPYFPTKVMSADNQLWPQNYCVVDFHTPGSCFRTSVKSRTQHK